jgi:hypothetical protein
MPQFGCCGEGAHDRGESPGVSALRSSSGDEPRLTAQLIMTAARFSMV